MFEDLRARALSGLALGAALFAALVWRGVFLLFVLLVVTVVGQYELYRALRRRYRPFAGIGLSGGAAVVLSASLGGFGPALVAVGATAVALIARVVFTRSDLREAALTLMAVVWVPGFLSFGIPIVRAPRGGLLVVAVVATIVMFDSGQYFVGRVMGRHRFAPTLSPQKTVEGLVGGAFGAFAVAQALSRLDPLSIASALSLAAVSCFAGVIGDGAVSKLKRSVGLKDIGRLIPGHGGLMDVMDSLVFAVPASYGVFFAFGYLRS